MIKIILFDLDGTLLPMDQEVFIKNYLGRLASYMAPHGYEPEKLVKTVWQGTGAMTANDGSARNEEVFWQVFQNAYGPEAMADYPIFERFYAEEFGKVRESCGCTPKAAELIGVLKEKGCRLVLATNPLFPAAATMQRIGWAGLSPEDFELVTTYENSRFCKPNPLYYRDVLDALGARPEECMMVGNDVTEDMAAGSLGMKTWLLTDCLINKNGEDIAKFAHGTMDEFLEYGKREM